jgi:hypothetical protein
MATSLALQVALAVQGYIANSLDVGSVNYPVSFTATYNFADGVGANQAKEIFTDTRTLTASASENLDLAGVLTDAFGNVITFTKIKAIVITADAANVNDVVIGNHATAAALLFFGAATHTAAIKPGGMLVSVAPDVNGYAVTATTADMLKVLNGGAGTSVNYTIAIIGTV